MIGEQMHKFAAARAAANQAKAAEQAMLAGAKLQAFGPFSSGSLASVWVPELATICAFA